MQAIIYVFIGGGIGSVLRYLISQFTQQPSNGFPLKTFFANVISCIILGFLFGYFLNHEGNDRMKLFLMTGLCGGFSTFSTFSLEVFQLIDNQQIGMAILYISCSVVICTLLLFGSYLIAQSIS